MDQPLTGTASPAAAPPLALPTRGASHDVVGRSVELSAIDQELAAAARGVLAAVALEGEPGIGKSRLMVAVAGRAREQGFATIAVTADEDLQGPFLVARSILGDAGAREAAGPDGAADLDRALAAVSGRDDPIADGLSPDEKLLRVFDLAAVAIRAVAWRTPLALLVDDLQWADGDSIRMLRYVVRTAADLPLFVTLAARPEELADTEAVPLLADMERMGLLRRLRLARLTPMESAELLRGLLAGKVESTTAATIHAQAEGVPFFLEEIARGYRDTGLLQQIDGTWTVTRGAQRLLPSAVRTLLQRRSARLPVATREVLAEAAVVGRAFSLRDVEAVRTRLGDEDLTPTDLADLLGPAVETGLLHELPADAPADYRFGHEQVRRFASQSLTPARRRAVHGALVDLLAADDPPPESLPLLARHALAAGDHERAASFSIGAAAGALAARAPDEALRIVDRALPTVSAPRARLSLLTAQDDALEMLRRPADRIEGLAELGALAEALGEPHLELEAMLRHAGARRQAGEDDFAERLASEVRSLAVEAGDRRAELAACLELGQAHVGRPLGESFSPSPTEVDFDAAEEAYRCARALARELGDKPALAAATRELGVLEVGRVRAWFVDQRTAGHLPELATRVAAGESFDDILTGLEVAPLAFRAIQWFEEAIGLFEELNDPRGLMSSIIAMAYVRFGPDIHLQASARRIEEIRNLSTQMLTLSRGSERGRAEAQMLYGVHVFARAKIVPDLSLSRGREAYDRAHLVGEESLAFAAAGGVAMQHVELGETGAAESWIDRAAAGAAASPTPFKARQLALWRGTCLAGAGDAAGARHHLERAVALATEQARPSARGQALARLALETARLGAAGDDAELLAVAEGAAAETRALVPLLPGHPLWGARADAALIHVALARGLVGEAVTAAHRALGALAAADLEDLNIDIRLPIARALLAGGDDRDREQTLRELHLGVTLVAQRIVDEDVRVRWFRGPLGRELTSLVGPIDPASFPASPGGEDLRDEDMRLLRLLVEGHTNEQIAAALGVDATTFTRLLSEFHARIGTSSRAEATTFAFRERVV